MCKKRCLEWCIKRYASTVLLLNVPKREIKGLPLKCPFSDISRTKQNDFLNTCYKTHLKHLSFNLKKIWAKMDLMFFIIVCHWRIFWSMLLKQKCSFCIYLSIHLIGLIICYVIRGLRCQNPKIVILKDDVYSEWKKFTDKNEKSSIVCYLPFIELQWNFSKPAGCNVHVS